MPRFVWFAIVAIVALAVLSPASAAGKHVALLIGNSDYQNATVLKNPVNDAADLGAALSRIGFTVTTLTNATAEQMQRAVAEFADKAKGADLALIFFAGHAIEIEGMHWSIPVDSKADSRETVASDSISLDRWLDSGVGSKLTIVLIDTARDNPFAKTNVIKPVVRFPALDVQSALVIYSTRSGSRPLDGEGRNSPFAAALLKHIEIPGLDLKRLVSLVRDEVLAATKGQQVPFSFGSLPANDIVLAPR